MTMAAEFTGNPSTDARRVEILYRFEEAWQQAPPAPNLDEFLPAASDSERRGLLIDLVTVDLERRIRAGQVIRVESYLERYRELASDRKAMVGLIVAEYWIRRRNREQVAESAYLHRFPQFASELPLRFREYANAADTTGFLSGANGPPKALPIVPGYEIVSELGRGGMGVVYMARQIRLKRIVALKMILSGSHAGADELGRFRAEALAVARLQHPGIVQIFEVGEADGKPFLALEFIDGGSLARKVKGKSLPPRQAARLVEDLAQAVHYAHQQGVVHRDLKPANILLTSGKFVPKITDFGLAKQFDSEAGGLSADAPTPSGAILGTPSYMAPEQAAGKGKTVGPAADVYALGAILYELLTARPPFKAANHLDILVQVLSNDPVPPSQLQPKVPRDLETICLKCLHKDQGKRYATAEELAQDLHRFLAGEPIVARRVGRWEKAVKWVRRNPVVSGLLAAVVLVLIAGTVLSLSFALRGDDTFAAEAARRNVEQANEARDRELVRGLVRALALQPGPFSDAEIKALWDLASSRRSNLGPRFVEQALSSPMTIKQLRNRAEAALHAATGLDVDKRAQIEGLLIEAMQAQGRDVEQRTDLALVSIALGNLTPKAANHVAQVLNLAIAKRNNPMGSLEDRNDLVMLGNRLSTLAAQMSPSEAVATLINAIATRPGPWLLEPLANGICGNAKNLTPREAAQAATKLTQALARKDYPVSGCDEWVAKALAAVAMQADPKTAAAMLCSAMQMRVSTRAIKWLTESLAIVAGRLEPQDAAKAAFFITKAMSKADRDSVRILARALPTLADRLTEADADQAAAIIYQSMAEREALPTGQAERELTGLAQALAAIMSRLRGKNAVRARAKFTEILLSDISGLNVQGWADWLGAVARHLDRADAAAIGEILGQAMVKGHPANRAALARGLGAVACRLDPKRAGRVAAILTRFVETNTNAHVAEALGTVATRLAPEDVERATRLLAEALRKASVFWHAQELARALLALADRMEPDRAALASFVLIQAIPKHHGAGQELTKALSAVAARLDSRATEAATMLAEIMSRTSGVFLDFQELAGCLRILASRLGPTDAARVASVFKQKLTNTPGDIWGLLGNAALAKGIAVFAARMHAMEAAVICAQSTRALADAMQTTNDVRAISAFAEGLAALTEFVEPKDAIAFNVQTCSILEKMIKKTNNYDQLATLATGLAAVSARLERKDRNRLCFRVNALFVKAIAKPLDSFQSDQIGRGLAALAERLEPSAAAASIMYALTKNLPMSDYRRFYARAMLTRRLQLLVSKMSMPEIVELLKNPICVGLAQSIILEQLQQKHRVVFADQWAFIRFVQEKKMGLDFVTPPNPPVLDVSKEP
jgi:hypothetical protein